MNNTTPLHRDEIAELLERVAAESTDHGEIVVVGGAALALMGLRDATNDIDTVTRLGAGTLAAIERVAESADLDKAFLNAGAAAFAPYGIESATRRRVAGSSTLTFSIPHADWLFLMKLNASRPGTDIDDMKRLWPLCSFATPDEAVRRFYEAYPSEEVDEFLSGFVAEVTQGADKPLAD